MRIAMVHPSLWGRGGAERQLLRLATELQLMGHEVEIFTDAVDENCYPELLKNLTVNVVPHPLWRLHRSLGYQATSSMVRREPQNARVASRFQRVMRKLVLKQYYAQELPLMLNLGESMPKGFDVINNHNPPSEWAALVAKRRLKVPVVWMCNGPPSWFLNPASRSAFSRIYWPLFEILDKVSVNYIDRIAAISYMSAKDVTRTYHRSCDIVRSGVDVEFFHVFSGDSFRKANGLENSFVLLQVGNLGLVRGNINSIKILRRLTQAHRDVKLIFDGYGSPEQVKSLRDLAEKQGLKNYLVIRHSTSDVELAEVYAACDVFIYPSHLTWSLAVSEAMAAGKPVIVPKDCGISEVIKNGVNGVVVELDTPEEIAKQIELLMDNPELRLRLGENAYAYVKKNLSWRQYAKNMEQVFEKAIANSQKA
jgi:glycosyltransferase involved in cell wall biosynthesis